ncbi:hypothetical protein BJ322DRAFT_128147 [Thelephora terrestris]|uniref:NB-ARC domain-containing protein n=1 Tax=Thelephora terrestris TaxID=56493 RepID=A0A9P6HRJ2_9AGAM|nr:hypothetical protein BJ322DRAFT_128147 [Thelephora terrestris]
MNATSQRPNGQDEILSKLNMAIEALDRGRWTSSIILAKVLFGSTSDLLAMIRDSMVNRTDYVELGLACAGVCKSLDRGTDGRRADQLNQSVFEAIERLATIVVEIQRSVGKLAKRSVISRLFRTKNDRDMIAAWMSDLNVILDVFNTELETNTRVAVSNTHNISPGIHRTTVEQAADDWNPLTLTSTPGESPPPPPSACFGRDELVEKIVGLAESLTSIALVGAGGMGKTSVALVVLHQDRMKKRFGRHRRFIRCDEFSASRAHFLARLSEAIGAGVEHPEDLNSLRPFLSSKEMLIVLDNAESILDLHGANGQEVYRLVGELNQFSNICLVITSRISIIPSNCETLEIPTLSTDAAYLTFNNIYKYDGRPDPLNNILKQLNFHPQSVALLATVAHQNMWNSDRLVRGWEEHKTGVLQHKTSLAATIELSLASPMFKQLGPDARELLGVIAFYPQGIDEKNLDWLLPTIPNRTRIFDQLRLLSLTNRNNLGFITVPAPLRDHLRPKNPMSSSLLCVTKERYFTRMSAKVNPNLPGSGDTRWILSEDTNVEHLLDVFTSVDPNSDDTWDACINFLQHLLWHKPRRTVLKRKIMGLPDNHRFKSRCLSRLASLSRVIGSCAEERSLLNHSLKLERERGNDVRVARVLKDLSNANRTLGRYKEGIDQAREALKIHERLDAALERAGCLRALARLLQDDGQLDAAEEALVESMKLLPEKGQEDQVCVSHKTLGDLYRSKGERDKAIHHFERALKIAYAFDWRPTLFWVQYSLAALFLDQGEFGGAQFHIERAKPYALDNAYNLGRAALLQASIWYQQRRLEDAASEALRARKTFEKLGNRMYLETCRALLQQIKEATESLSPFGGSDPNAYRKRFHISANTLRDF